MNEHFWRALFGPESRGATPQERASSSPQRFVRSQDHLAFDNPSATGRRLTAREALDAYGLTKLTEALEYGAAILPTSRQEPAQTLRLRREALGLTRADVARQLQVTEPTIEGCEDPQQRAPIQLLERVAMSLGLDERMLSIEPGAAGNDALALRLKTLGEGPQALTAHAVLSFAEAAWIIQTQDRLRALLGLSVDLHDRFLPSDNYGAPGYPAWQHGIYLAQRTRDLLGLSPTAPIPSMRALCESLQLPLVQMSLGSARLAGAAISSSGRRGIVINVDGDNANVWVRRATIAHELGHLLWDPEPRLRGLTVDSYEALGAAAERQIDHVEARANAFAVSFLAPPAAVRAELRRHPHLADGVCAVMTHFGISYTAACYHIQNVTGQPLHAARPVEATPDNPWEGRESFTADYFPLAETPLQRRGAFAGLVCHAEQRGLISTDTACQYLGEVREEAYLRARAAILGLFPLPSEQVPPGDVEEAILG